MTVQLLPTSARAVAPASATDVDEAALVEAARRGDARAFDLLYRRHVQAVYRRLTRLLGPTGDREDLVQQVFLQLHRAIPNFRGDAPFGAFVHGITVRVGYTHLRTRTRSTPFREQEMAELVSPGSSPEAAAREREQLALAFTRLDKLKPKKRVAFVLHVIEGVPLEEMARMLDTDARTLGQRVAHARRELLAMFERDEGRARAQGGER